MSYEQPHQAQEPTGEGPVRESLGAEVWRLWTSEIKPHFKAEAEFLQKYGENAGYGRDYIGRVLADHRLMEELVWADGDAGVARFAKVLAAHIRFKQEFFAQMVRNIVDAGNTPPEAASDGQNN
jgi:hypothetical protein